MEGEYKEHVRRTLKIRDEACRERGGRRNETRVGEDCRARNSKEEGVRKLRQGPEAEHKRKGGIWTTPRALAG